MSDDVVTFHSVLPRRRGGATGRTDWKVVADALRERPGQWGDVGEFTPGMVTYLRQGRQADFLPSGFTDERDERAAYMKAHWEFTQRKTSETKGNGVRVFIRWLG